MANTVKERMGMRVTGVTLKEDRGHTQGWGSSWLEAVNGSVEIDVLPACILRTELVLEIAELMAQEAAYDVLPRNVEVLSWKAVMKGEHVTVTAQEVMDVDPDTHLRRDTSEFAQRQRPLEGF